MLSLTAASAAFFVSTDTVPFLDTNTASAGVVFPNVGVASHQNAWARSNTIKVAINEPRMLIGAIVAQL
jgi:hypothetical protein